MNVPDPRSIPPASSIATRWVTRRTFAADGLANAAALAEVKQARPALITVVVTAPAASAIGRICSSIETELMRDAPLIDELIVLTEKAPTEAVRSSITPATRLLSASSLIPEVPVHDGRGDLLWRSLTAVRGEIVVWIDGDDRSFEPHVVTRLLAPLLWNPSISFVRGFDSSEADFKVEIEDVVYLAGGARVAELLGRPLLNIFFPELGGFFQPLVGPSAGRVDVLRKIPFVSDCSVDIAMLIDLCELVGVDGLAQADITPRRRGNRPLGELGPEAHAIARTILQRAEQANRIKLAPTAVAHPFLVRTKRGVKACRIDEIERPPVEVLPPYLAALRSAPVSGDSRYVTAGGSR